MSKLLLWVLAKPVAETVNAFQMRLTGHGRGGGVTRKSFCSAHTAVTPLIYNKVSFQSRPGFPLCPSPNVRFSDITKEADTETDSTVSGGAGGRD